MTTVTHIKETNITLSDHEREFIEEKFSVLEKYRNGEEAFMCDVEVERSNRHLTGDVVRAEINVTLRGNVYRSEATRDTLMNALDEVREDIVREIREAQDKKKSLFKRGAHKVKRMMGMGE